MKYICNYNKSFCSFNYMVDAIADESCDESCEWLEEIESPQAEQATASCLSELLADPSLIYAEAVNKWGNQLQFDMLIEECAELIAAMNRLRRGRTDLLPFLEELADVEIMLGQMRCIFDNELLDSVKRKKLTRLAERTGQHVVLYG